MDRLGGQKERRICPTKPSKDRPEKRSHSSPLRSSGIPLRTSSLVLEVRYIQTPRPNSEKWMFHASTFIFSFICRRTRSLITHSYHPLRRQAGSHGFGAQVLLAVLVQLQQTLAGCGQLWVVLEPPLRSLGTWRHAGGHLKTNAHVTNTEADLRTGRPGEDVCSNTPSERWETEERPRCCRGFAAGSRRCAGPESLCL